MIFLTIKIKGYDMITLGNIVVTSDNTGNNSDILKYLKLGDDKVYSMSNNIDQPEEFSLSLLPSNDSNYNENCIDTLNKSIIVFSFTANVTLHTDIEEFFYFNCKSYSHYFHYSPDVHKDKTVSLNLIVPCEINSIDEITCGFYNNGT